MSGERESVRLLGERLGYGNMMRLAEELCVESLNRAGYNGGGAFSVGPLVADLVTCPCVEGDRAHGRNCDWCCNTGRVTKRVAQAMGAVDK